MTARCSWRGVCTLRVLDQSPSRASRRRLAAFWTAGEQAGEYKEMIWDTSRGNTYEYVTSVVTSW